VMYYIAIITSVMMPQDDPGETECPCVKGGMSQPVGRTNTRVATITRMSSTVGTVAADPQAVSCLFS
jgi:hypothetical protein